MLGRGLAIAALLAFATTADAQDKKPPYWASIASGEAMMRTGPGRNYPGVWLYKRRDLPIRVIQVYPNWRKIEDPNGTQGWMLVTLLSERRDHRHANTQNRSGQKAAACTQCVHDWFPCLLKARNGALTSIARKR